MTTERIEIEVTDNGTTNVVKRSFESLRNEVDISKTQAEMLKAALKEMDSGPAGALRSAASAAEQLKKASADASGSFRGQELANQVKTAETALNRATRQANALKTALKEAKEAAAAEGIMLGGGGGSGGGGGGGAGKGPANDNEGPEKVERVGTASRSAMHSLLQLNHVMYLLGAALAVEKVGEWADAWLNVENRLKTVTTSMGNLNSVAQEIFDMAQQVRMSLDHVTEGYMTLAVQAKDYGLSQRQTIDLYRGIAEASQVANGGNQAAETGVSSLMQGIGKGYITARQLETIIKDTPALGQAIADGMGMSLDKVMKIAESAKTGGLGAHVVVHALGTQLDEISAKFAQVNPTIAGSFIVMHNAASQFLGKLNESTGVIDNIARLIMGLANHLDILAAGLVVVGSLMLISFGPMVLDAIRAFGVGIADMFALNPVLVWVVGIGAAVTALILLGDRIKVSSDGVVSLRDVMVTAWQWIVAGIQHVADWLVQLFQVFFPTNTQKGQQALGELGQFIVGLFGGVMEFLRKVIIFVTGGWIFAFLEVKTTWNNLTGFFSALLTGIIDLVAIAVETFVNSWQTGFRTIANIAQYVAPDMAKALNDALDKTELKLPRVTLDDSGKAFADETAKNFAAAFGEHGVVGSAMDDALAWVSGMATRFMADARANATKGAGTGVNAGAVPETGTDPTGHKGAHHLTRAELLAQETLKAGNELKRLTDYTGEAALAVDKDMDTVAEALNQHRFAPLSPAEEAQFRKLFEMLEHRKELHKEETKILKDTIDPQHDYELGIEAINDLMSKHLLTMEQYTKAMEDVRIKYLKTKTDMQSGLELGQLETDKYKRDDASRASSAYQSQWKAANDGVLQYNSNVAALQRLMQTDPINKGTYAIELQKLRFQYAQLQLAMGKGNTWTAMRAGLGQVVADYKGILPGLGQAWGNFFTSLSNGFSQHLTNVLMGTEKLGAAFKAVASEAIGALLQALIKLGIQWLIMKAFSHAAQAEQIPVAVAAGTAVAAAWAPAAAMVSLATLGANSASAIAGIITTTAIADAMALPAFAGGGSVWGAGTGTSDSILARLSHGEYVVNARAANDNRALLDAINYGLPMYASGGSVGVARLPSSASPRAVYSAPVSGGDTYELHIDARGSEVGVEQRIRDVLAEEGPKIVSAARQLSAQDLNDKLTRQNL